MLRLKVTFSFSRRQGRIRADMRLGTSDDRNSHLLHTAMMQVDFCHIYIIGAALEFLRNQLFETFLTNTGEIQARLNPSGHYNSAAILFVYKVFLEFLVGTTTLNYIILFFLCGC